MASPTWAQEPSAKDHYNAGIIAFEQGNDQVAYDELTHAYRLDPSYQTAGARGQAAGELGRYVEAANLLEESLQKMPSAIEPTVRARVTEDLERLRLQVLTVIVEGAPELRVELPNGDVRQSPSPFRVYLEPGPGEVRISGPGGAALTCRVTGADGTNATCNWLTLSAEAARSTAVVTPPVESAPRDSVSLVSHSPRRPLPVKPGSRWKLPVAIASGGVALLGGAAGSYFMYQAHNADNRLPGLRQQVLSAGDTTACGPSTADPPQACVGLTNAIERRTDQYNLAVASFVVAGVFAAAGVTFWLWDSSESGQLTVGLRPDEATLGYAW